jgi:hypothetical protein
LLLCEKEDTLNILKALPTPVDYGQPFHTFLEEVIILVAEASGMPCIALHEWREDALQCLKTYGLSEDDLQILPVMEHSLFNEVLTERKTIIVKDLDSRRGQKFIENLKLRQVKSFIVTPLSVGKEVFGTLLFAVLSDHSYTTLEQSGLETIANTIGVAIANYRNFHKAEGHLFEQAKIGAAITTVDVAQSARHEAMNYLQNSQELLALLSRSMLGLPGKQIDQINKLINEISRKLGDLGHALQKIKTITKPPDREKTPQRVDDLWREAFGLALGRLDQQNIRWNIQGSATAKVAVDYLTHAFLHLGPLPDPADLMQPAAHRFSRDHEAPLGPQGQGQGGATPPRAAPPIRPGGRLEQGQQRPAQRGDQHGGAHEWDELPLVVYLQAERPCPIRLDRAVHTGARAEEDSSDRRRLAACGT